jgi:hypothetical protein
MNSGVCSKMLRLTVCTLRRKQAVTQESEVLLVNSEASACISINFRNSISFVRCEGSRRIQN